MEIGPIPAIRTLPTARILKEDPRLTGFLDIEQIAASKEDTFSSGDERMSGGQDGDAPDDEQHQEPAEETSADDSSPTVNLFA
jgi:hypothetical protein